MKENDLNYKQFYELACWADDLKQSAMTSLDGWHIFNQGYFDGIRKEDAKVITNEQYCVPDTVVFLTSFIYIVNYIEFTYEN